MTNARRPETATPGERRVFLHVGSPKTGTTFLQAVLWSQREKAAEQGLLLPLERFFDHYLASLDLRGLSDRPEHPPRAVGMWDRLVEASASWPGSVLISHELFAAATPAQAQRALTAFPEGTEVHVVLTARDLVRQIPAEWQEHVKHRSTKTLVEFIEDLRREDYRKSWFWRVQDFAGILERWGATLPASRVHLVTVPPPGAPPDLLWTRFATLLGLDPSSFDTTVSRANTSLGIEQAELLRRLNGTLGERLPLPGPYAPVVKNVFAQQVLAGRPGRRLALTEEDTDYAVTRSRDIAGRLSRMSIDVVGDLDELIPHPPQAQGSASDEPTDDVLLAESLEAISTLLVRLNNRRLEDVKRAEEAARGRGVRLALIRASERRPLVMKARQAYRWVHGLGARVRGKPRV